MAKKSQKSSGKLSVLQAYYRSRKANFAPTAVTIFEFPPEIENMIFEWAARKFPGQAAALSIVCRRIQPYVESVIYESLLIVPSSGRDDVPELAIDRHILPTLLSRPPAFFAAHVRNLVVRNSVPMDFIGTILSKCTAIRHLVLAPDVDGIGLTVTATAHTLTSLCTTRHVAREMAECGIVFPNLLFLGLYFISLWERVMPLEWMPSLRTVLLDLSRVPGGPHEGWIQDIEMALSTTPQLKTLMLNAYNRSMHAVNKYVQGRRQHIASHIEITVSNKWDLEDVWRSLYMGEICP